jgi:NitT/TauT family transport system ATP-binding protein
MVLDSSCGRASDIALPWPAWAWPAALDAYDATMMVELVTKPLVSLRDAGKIYKNGTVALAGLDLDVREGEFLTLLGPSGCGKSTILRLIAGLDSVSSGTLTRGLARDRASIGFVFQDPTLMPWASVFDNVFLGLRLQGISRRDAAPVVNEVLALVGLGAEATAFPRELSGGMRMRVSIARALVLHPPLLLMDEPFAALDEITRFKLNDDLLTLHGELATTIVFVTHSVYESVYLSSRIAVMASRPGRIIEEIAISAPSPRAKNFRTGTAYANFCAQASLALQGAMDEVLK